MVTHRYRALQREANYKSSTFVSASILLTSRLKHIVVQEWQEIIYRGTSVWYSPRSSSQQYTAVNWQMRVRLIFCFGKELLAHWTGKNTLNSSMEHVCNLHLIRTKTESMRKQQMCHLCNHLSSADNNRSEVRDILHSQHWLTQFSEGPRQTKLKQVERKLRLQWPQTN